LILVLNYKVQRYAFLALVAAALFGAGTPVAHHRHEH
jgi:hypothetical protein